MGRMGLGFHSSLLPIPEHCLGPHQAAAPGRDRWTLSGVLGGFVDRDVGRFLGTRAGLHGLGLQGQGGRLSRPAEP